MKCIKIFFLLAFSTLYCQTNNKTIPIKFQGELKGIFEVVEINTSKSKNVIKLRLNYLLNDHGFEKNYYALLISDKKAKLTKHESKLMIGQEYYFELHHLFFYKSLFPGPNTIPYTYNIDGTRIWEESSDYGIYLTP